MLRQGQAHAGDAARAAERHRPRPEVRRPRRSTTRRRARALLDKFGYIDRDGDGLRETAGRQAARAEDGHVADARWTAQYDELWQRSMNADRPARRVRQAEVARPAQDGAARPAADVAARQHQHDAPKASASSALLYGGNAGLLQPRPLQAGRVRQAVRRGAGDARRGRSATGCVRGCRELVDAYAPWKLDMRTATRTCSCSRGSSATSTTRSTSIRGSTSTSIVGRQAAQGASNDRAPALARRCRAAARSRSRSSLRSAGAAQPAPRRSGEGAARRVPDRRDRLRSAGDVSDSTPSTSSARSSTAVRVRLPGAAVQARAAHGGGDAGDLRGRPHVDDQGASRASTSPTIRRSRARSASSTAADYVYAWKRLLDPKVRSPILVVPRRQDRRRRRRCSTQAKASGQFDYDAPIEGLQALDRYTLQHQARTSPTTSCSAT